MIGFQARARHCVILKPRTGAIHRSVEAGKGGHDKHESWARTDVRQRTTDVVVLRASSCVSRPALVCAVV